MTRFIYDTFSKDYLSQLLKPYGKVKTSRKVVGEVREIDVFFNPKVKKKNLDLAPLGLLGRFASTPAILEPFRNHATEEEICDCMLKQLEVRGELKRKAKRSKQKFDKSLVPKLWILTPTASEALISGFNAYQDDEWLPGMYFMGKTLRCAIVVIHQLPRTPETLPLKILGRDAVQDRAIEELKALPENNPLRQATLEFVHRLQLDDTTNEQEQELEPEEQELIMRLKSLFKQHEEEIEEKGRQKERRQVIENLLSARFGTLDAELSAIVEPLLALPPSEFTLLLVQRSRQELIAQFGQKS